MIYTIDQTQQFFEELLDNVRKPSCISDTQFEIMLRDAIITTTPKTRLLLLNNSHDSSRMSGSLVNSFTLDDTTEKMISNRYRNYLYEYMTNSHAMNFITLSIHCPYDQAHYDMLIENHNIEKNFYPMLNTRIIMKNSTTKFVLTINQYAGNSRNTAIKSIKELFEGDDNVIVGKDFIRFDDEMVIQMVLPYIQNVKAELIMFTGEYK